ncbi:MAG: YfhO family protein [Candidatus Gottesmanbacteria bacterium]
MKKIFLKILPIIALLALWITFSFPYIGKGLVPLSSTYLVTFFPPWSASYGMPVKNNAMPDIITQIYPWKQITIESLKLGQIPLWNPFSFSGTVHAGNYQSAIFSPFNVLFFIFSFIDAWSIFILLQPILAGLGTYLFIRSLGRSKSASLLGAVAYMFCGFMTTWMAYGTLGYAALCLPWALWAVTAYMKKQSTWCPLILSLCLAISFFAGHFQISLYVLAAVVAYILFVTLSTKQWKLGIMLLLYTAIGVLIASPQILLTLDAYSASTRSTSFMKGEVIPWRYLITLFSPDFYGNPVTRNDWFGHYAEWASYVGVAPLILAMFAITKKLKGYIRFFAVLGCFSIFLAYPTPLNDLLYALKLPAISTSAASRIIILFSFSLAMLSAFGLDELVTVWKGKDKKSIIPFIIWWGILLVVIWITVLFIRPFPLEKLSIAKRNLLLPTALTFATVFLMSVGFIKKYKPYMILVVLLLGLSMFDSYRYASKWMPFDKKEYVYPEMKSLTFLKQVVGHNRVFGNIGNEVGATNNLLLIEGYDAMYQGRYGAFISAASTGIASLGGRSVVMLDKHGIFTKETLQLLGVRYFYHRVGDGRNVWAFPVWEYPDGQVKQIYKDEQYEIYEDTNTFPRAFLASEYVVATEDQTIIDTLFSKDMNRKETLVLEEEPAIRPEAGEGKADILKYSANVIRIRTESTAPKLLFLSDVYDDGWKATIDGSNTHIYRADYDFRAIAVPSGIHTVEYRYHPKGFRIGMITAIISIVIGIGGVIVLKKKQTI